MNEMEKPTRVVVIPSPGFSHVASILEFAKRIVKLPNGIHVTLLIPTIANNGSPSEASKAILQSLPSTINYTFLPPIHDQELPQEAPIALTAQIAVSRSVPSIRHALMSLTSTSRLVAIVADLFGIDALILAKEMNLLSFVYCPSTAMTLSFCFFLPKLDDTVIGEFKEISEPVRIPGCVPVPGRDLPNPVQDRNSELYRNFLQRCKQLRFADGILVNSFREIEPGPIRELTEEGRGYPMVYPVGPIIQNGSGNETKFDQCLTWLDNHVPNSVIYVCFGSGGTLSQDQLNELAMGLELSGKKFLWVIRAPSESANASYLSGNNNNGGDPLRFLPSGFLDRTKKQGLVVPLWAPQAQILNHHAIGGFLTHCGWNSVLEGVMNGVPLIAWPLFAEQKMSAIFLSEDLKVALRVKANENGLVEREEVACVIRRLMEDEEYREIRRRMQSLKNVATESLQEEGSQNKILAQFAVHLMKN
ncbi:hydroquinone glucosyltransferase [Arachis duranensis]|uniref:Glycosyltransferase n=2 Tax=Arachis TaxID=3817 RepID=A0A445BZR1_ARAHY|nr:hydroquinone glucosyltransferase [Arachis duranensis]XP_029144426.1 hydroquinone glucosyltransferase [Arachis hypogaea]QHO32098.1 Hydroquinone glucosyltransferase [Arachis hypogaea]RYR44250.1 hypothetical protein Ahy_A08g040619 [Arachis hypogaea]